jgi:hypothetical protein
MGSLREDRPIARLTDSDWQHQTQTKLVVDTENAYRPQARRNITPRSFSKMQANEEKPRCNQDKSTQIAKLEHLCVMDLKAIASGATIGGPQPGRSIDGSRSRFLGAPPLFGAIGREASQSTYVSFVSRLLSDLVIHSFTFSTVTTCLYVLWDLLNYSRRRHA